MRKKFLLLVLCFLIVNACGVLYASERAENEHIYTIEYYLSAPLTAKEQKEIVETMDVKFEHILEEVKKSGAEEDLLAVLRFSQLYAFVHITDTENEKIIVRFEEVRDMGLAYLRTQKSYDVELELAVFVNYAFPLLSNNFYQSIKITRDLASKTYRKNKNAKSALMLGISYAGGVLGFQANNNKIFAEKYLQEAIDLDQHKTYVTYLSYIHLANLYFKSFDNNKAKDYIEKAKVFFPDGYYAYVVESFFQEGNALF